MVDEKRCYLFGRNQQMNDFCIDHASCSRVHSALVYHKHLDRAFLVDLGSSKLNFHQFNSIYSIDNHFFFLNFFSKSTWNIYWKHEIGIK